MGPFIDGMSYLEGHEKQDICAGPHDCARPSCSHGTGIAFCNDNGDAKCRDINELGAIVQNLMLGCGYSGACLEKRDNPRCNDFFDAMQVFLVSMDMTDSKDTGFRLLTSSSG